jgi:hypothetical protein
MAKSHPTSRVAARNQPRLEVPALSAAEVIALKATPKATVEIVKITPPKLRVATIKIRGISAYVQHAFSEKARKQMEETQRQGTQARSRRVRAPKDFEGIYEAAMHRSVEGWLGIPAPAFRNAAIDACRLVGYKMTHAKLSLFIVPDGTDKHDGTPLVRIIGEPRVHESFARNESGVADLRWRPLWDQWSAVVRVQWDEDQFSSTDIHNLMLRAGLQVGIGEGRPSSPNSNGLGWGRFEVVP